MSLIAELKQRKVFRVAAAYAVVAWLLIQVVATVGPALKLPDWTLTFTTVLLGLGFPVALVLAWVFDVVRTRRGPRDAGEAGATADGIAVLPLANLTGEAEQGYLADGIVEDVLTRLQTTPGLRVVSRQSSHAYQGRSVDARTIARELACRYVVEGSMRKAGDRVRITVQLIDALTDRHVWAERYDRRLEDAFELQDEICDHVVAAIQSRILHENRAVPATVTASPTPRAQRALPLRWAIPGLVALVALAALLTWTLQKRGEERRAREDALPRLQALVAADDYAAAFDLAREIESVTPNDPVLVALRPEFSAPVRLRTEPEGAKVYYRPYSGTEHDWRLLGQTPLVDVPVPLGVGLWRFEKEGRATSQLVLRNPGLPLGNHPFSNCAEKKDDPKCIDYFFSDKADFTIPLADAGTSPPDMVLVPDMPATIPTVGDGTFTRLPPFFMDRTEVSNKAYAEFVDAGGYAEAAYWQDLPLDGTDTTDWRALVQRLVDATGRPGPSTWQAGRYPDGAEELPVTGISWFEAAAYCRYRGKELPTAYHWYRAANSVQEGWDALSSFIVKESNFSGRALQPVNRVGAIGPYGTQDMAGNAREWLWNRGASGRWNVGGAYVDPTYMYAQQEEALPTDRSEVNGVRCMRTIQGGPTPEDLRQPIVATIPDFAAMQPVDDAAFGILAQQLAYEPAATLRPAVTDMKSSNSAWTRQRIKLPTGYDETTFAVDLFLPTVGKGPYSVIFYFPHAGEFTANVTLDDFDPVDDFRLGYMLKAGRGIAVIAFDGSFDRRWSPARIRASKYDDRYRTWMRHWRQELGRTIDYLSTRKDVDAGKLGCYAFSMGASRLSTLLAVEKRIGAAVLYGGGTDIFAGLPMAEQPFNYFPRITQPVLMLNGKFDMVFPSAAQQHMLELLGASSDRKKRVVFEGGHIVLPRFQVQQLSLEWFDTYLGPTQTRATSVAK